MPTKAKPKKPANLCIDGNSSACCITSDDDLVFDDTITWNHKSAARLHQWLGYYVAWRDHKAAAAKATKGKT